MCTIQQALIEPQQRTGAVATLATDHPHRSPLNSSKRPSHHDQIGGAPPDRLRRKIHRSLITSSRAVEPARSPSPSEAADWSHQSVRRGATTRVAATGSETASNRGYARAACARGISRGGAEALWNSLYPRVMLLEELLSVVETLRGRIAAHGPALRQSEALTRYALIDPLLRGLGWDTADPSQVLVEYRSESGSADYALLGADGKPQVIVEAKKLGTPLQTAVQQAINYCIIDGFRYFAVTDGQHWQLYNTPPSGPAVGQTGHGVGCHRFGGPDMSGCACALAPCCGDWRDQAGCGPADAALSRGGATAPGRRYQR